MIFGEALTDPTKVPAFVDDMAAWGFGSLTICVGWQVDAALDCRENVR
jgi:hypothetical protein